MDIPSLHEVHQWLETPEKMQLQTVNCSVCNAEFPVEAISAHSCAPYLKQRLDELEDTVRELEWRHARMEDQLLEMEQKLWVMQDDSR